MDKIIHKQRRDFPVRIPVVKNTNPCARGHKEIDPDGELDPYLLPEQLSPWAARKRFLMTQGRSTTKTEAAK